MSDVQARNWSVFLNTLKLSAFIAALLLLLGQNSVAHTETTIAGHVLSHNADWPVEVDRAIPPSHSANSEHGKNDYGCVETHAARAAGKI